ncbi:hypothetical protein GXW82_30900 [Streptacidiphilus sp. 4-A2]|nr:hypothetical protein [Streptacidiphilus sp. 4-A2]
MPERRARRRRGGAATALVLGVLGGLALHSLAGIGGAPAGPQSGPGYQNAATSSTAGGGSTTPSAGATPPYPVLPPAGDSVGWPGTAAAGSGAPPGSLLGSRSGSVMPWTSGPPGMAPAPGGATAAECSRDQLGNGSSTVGAAGSDGTAYGSFQVANVSQTTCQVSQPGTVSVIAVSGTVASRIAVMQHSTTDPATLLPSPAATPSPVLLAPGQFYTVDFAWVPTTGTGTPTCASTAPPGSPSPPRTVPPAPTRRRPPLPGPRAATGAPRTTLAPSATPPSVTLGHTPGGESGRRHRGRPERLRGDGLRHRAPARQLSHRPASPEGPPSTSGGAARVTSGRAARVTSGRAWPVGGDPGGSAPGFIAYGGP